MRNCPRCYAPGGLRMHFAVVPGMTVARLRAFCTVCERAAEGRLEREEDGTLMACYLDSHDGCPPESDGR